MEEVYRRNAVRSERPIKRFAGKCSQNPLFGPVVAALIVLGLFVCGFCEEFSMASLPLGFELSVPDSKYWVSENGVFAFGFLSDSQEGDAFLVGIRYNMKEIGEELITVWTVGGGLRVSKNSTFKLSIEGSLCLYDNPNSLLLWSSNTGNLGVQEASLLNNGNLILKGSGEKVLWESFHSPTDTLLPGQSLQFSQSLQAPSINSVSGFYSLVIRQSGNVVLMWDRNVTYWSSNIDPSIVAKEARFEPNGVFGLFDGANHVVWSRTSKDFQEPSVNFRHLRIDPDGNLRIYSWDNVDWKWRIGWQAVEKQCNIFGSCGLYSICGYNSTGPICECLVKDSLSVGAGTGLDVGSYGCKKMVDLANCKMGTSMLVLKQTVLYGLYPPHDYDTMLNAEACEKFCLKDPSCFAATAKNDGSGLCTIKRTSFISGYQCASVSSVSFLKVCLVPQAASTHQAANFGMNSSSPFYEERYKDDQKGFIVSITLLLVITASVFLIMEMLVIWFIYRRRQIAKRRVPFQKAALMDPHYSALIRLSFEEVKDLTKNFVDSLGPTVFKGVLPNRTSVVAKVLSNVVISEREFFMVISTLGATHHRNLVPLKGFCFEPKHKILVYEYVTCGSLDQWLFNKRGDTTKDSWQQRLEIAIGVARAIAYLHVECHQCIAHGSLRLENILLDEKLVAKVTDFGLKSLLGIRTVSPSETLPQRDIYMFGEMLLQLVTGKKGDVVGKMYSLIYEMCQDGDLGAITDIQLDEGCVEREGVERAVRIAFWCMQDQPFLRPSMGEVVKVLEGSLHVDKPPICSACATNESQKADREREIVEVAP